MNLNELDAEINQPEKQKEVSNADMLASLVIIQGQLQKIEKFINENQNISQKNYAEIKDILAAQDKNISAIPVLTANIISEKTNKIATQISNVNDTFAKSIIALNQSNGAFKTLLQAWLGTMALFAALTIFLIFWR